AAQEKNADTVAIGKIPAADAELHSATTQEIKAKRETREKARLAVWKDDDAPFTTELAANTLSLEEAISADTPSALPGKSVSATATTPAKTADSESKPDTASSFTFSANRIWLIGCVALLAGLITLAVFKW